MTDQTPLRILSFDVSNILRVSAVHIDVKGNVVELTGKNRNGKSSTIDALWMALGGKDMIPPDPIRDGAEVGTVMVNIGDAAGPKYKVTRTLKRREDNTFATSLTIASPDGAKFEKPQKILDDIIGALSCDPLDFIEMKPAEQFEMLKGFVPGFDFAADAKAHQADFDKRTEVNRDAKQRRAQADGIVIPEAPLERQDEAALVAELAGAADKNTAVQQHRTKVDRLKRQAEEADELAERARSKITELRAQITKLEQDIDGLENAAANFRLEISDAGDEPPPVDTTTLQAQIAAARTNNAAFDAAERALAEKARLTTEATGLEEQSKTLTKALENREAARAKAISEAKLPVAGIGFGDGIVLLNGHPIKNASQAEQLEAAISIAVALQPRLRFVTTKNAALLDPDSWAALVTLAEKQDLLVIAETVNSDRPSAVVIEDGMVRGAAKQQAAE